jgi:hypothetical protein
LLDVHLLSKGQSFEKLPTIDIIVRIDEVLDDGQHAKGLEKLSYYDSKIMDLHLHDLSSLVKKPGNGAK